MNTTTERAFVSIKQKFEAKDEKIDELRRYNKDLILLNDKLKQSILKLKDRYGALKVKAKKKELSSSVERLLKMSHQLDC